MGKVDLAAAKMLLDQEINRSSQHNVVYDHLQPGKNVRRLLWPKGTKTMFYTDGYMHFGLGPEGRTVVTCPKTHDKNARCPICDYVEQLKNSDNPDDKALAEDIRSKRRIYINVINRDEDDNDSPRVLAIGATLLKALLNAMTDPDYGDITRFDGGRDLTITRKGQGLKTEYSMLPKPNASLTSEIKTEAQIEEEMAELSSLFIKRPIEELRALVPGYEAVQAEEEDSAYERMELNQLEKLCQERDIKVPIKSSKLKLITLLNIWDEEHANDEWEATTQVNNDSNEVLDELTAVLGNNRQ